MTELLKLLRVTGSIFNIQTTVIIIMADWVFRADVEPGAYRVTVECADGTTKDTAQIAVSGMQASRLTSTSAWDNAKLVKRNTSASFSGTTWQYDFVTGEDFIEIEVEPKAQPKADDPQTVGVKSISIAQIEKEASEEIISRQCSYLATRHRRHILLKKTA